MGVIVKNGVWYCGGDGSGGGGGKSRCKQGNTGKRKDQRKGA